MYFIFILLGIYYFYYLISENNNKTKKGEDDYYQHLIKKYENYNPIQLGYFKLKTESSNDFKIIIEKMEERVENHVKNNWKNTDENIFSEIKEIEDIKKINCDKIKVFIIRYHLESKSIYIMLNHSVVGGGDYLILGTVMFEGKSNILLKEPDNSFYSRLICSFAKLDFKYKIFKDLYFKQPRIRNNNEEIIQSSINLEKLKIEYSKNIKTKYLLIYKIMNNIMSSTRNTDKLICWIPVGFNKTKYSPNNNIGIIIFTFKRGMSLIEMKNVLDSNKHLAIGSRQTLIEDTNIPFIDKDRVERIIKKNIDVVLTLANIIDNKIKVDCASGGMYYKINIADPPYPYYIWGTTMNGTSHISYNVSDKLCNLNKLIDITNGENITGKHIYQLNKIDN